jgi:tetratricopeptide (TPR) repeat protein
MWKAPKVEVYLVVLLVWMHVAAFLATAQEVAVPSPVGTVHFPVSCKPAAAGLIERGVALLHHMMYQQARALFEQARSADPTCAMALWGIGTTLIHPLWPDRPTPEALKRGATLAREASSLGAPTQRERDYLATLPAYFENGADLTEAERLARSDEAWRRVHESHPDDQEAAAFYALAHMATADSSDRSYTKQRRAGAIVERVLARAPDHPGAHHYIIHAYDSPLLARRALEVARGYGNIAPDVPHALHMPSHIFTRLGLWDESIEWNLRSAEAAWRMSEQAGEVLAGHYLHPLDYLVYAYLQKGMDGRAAEIVVRATTLEPPYGELNRFAAGYALASVPARYALERHDWDAAVALVPRSPENFPWDETLTPYVAITHFARALGFARAGRVDEAQVEIAELTSIRDALAEDDAYWAGQVEIQRDSALAWTRLASGEPQRALELMTQAAALESATHKSPVTPGEVLPARELLGDMLLEMGRFEEASQAYETALARSPGRLNSVYGAARSAELSGDSDRARQGYQQLVAMTEESASRDSLQHARRFLSQTPAASE